MKYASCVGFGNCNCDDEREALENATFPEMVIAFAISVMFINCSNLLFIVQVKDIKNLAQRATRSIMSSDIKDTKGTLDS